MNAKKVLTGSPPEAAPLDLKQALADAGLELWHAPEGFWAIRVKRPAVASAETRGRRRARGAF